MRALAFLLLCSIAIAEPPKPRRCSHFGSGKTKSKDPFDRACAHCQWRMRSSVGFGPNETFRDCVDKQVNKSYRMVCEGQSIMDEPCVWYPSPSPAPAR